MDLPVRRSIFSVISLNFAGNVGGCGQSRTGGVAVADLAGVVHDDDLGEEGGGLHGVGSFFESEQDVAAADVLDGDVLDVEADVVAGETLGEDLVVHLDRLDSVFRYRRSCRRPGGAGGGACRWGREGGSMASMASRRVLPVTLPALVSALPALVPGHLLGGLDHVCRRASREMGTKATVLGL
ncbi:hypothetical protein L1887_48291 [Cichorium endivia]|nr:hypothetical protein L1887_48291 [Cichorium endivia]